MFRRALFALGLLVTSISPVFAASGGAICDPVVTGQCAYVNTSHQVATSASLSGGVTTAVPTTNGAGTITTGGTFQSVANANTARLSIEFQNTNATDACYIFFGTSGELTTNSIVVAAGQDYLRSVGTIPSDKVWVTCATTSDTFYFAVQ
jgi:hypothetical protein